MRSRSTVPDRYTNNGKIYAPNGSAKEASHNDPSMSKVEDIWLGDPKWAGLKISYGDFYYTDSDDL